MVTHVPAPSLLGGGPSLPLASPTRVVLKVQSLQQQHGLGVCEKFLGFPGQADRPPGSHPSLQTVYVGDTHGDC